MVISEGSKTLRVAWLYPKPKRHLLCEYECGKVPDKLSGLPFMSRFNIKCDLIDPYNIPTNPFARMHSLFSGVDPARGAMTVLGRRKYDLLFSVGESSLLSILFLQQITNLKLPPLIVWDPALTDRWKMRYNVLRYVLPKVNKILVIGHNQKKFVQENFHCGSKCEVVPHWIDCEYFSPEKANYRDNTEPYILTVGNDSGRDYSTLLKAVEPLGIRTILKTSLIHQGGKPNIVLNKKHISFSELRDLYANASFVIVPLHNTCHAGGINGLQEAMAMGKATIVSRSEGIMDHVLEGKTSIVVEPGNVQQLQLAIQNLWLDPERAFRMGQVAREYVNREFDSKILANKFAQIFRATHLAY